MEEYHIHIQHKQQLYACYMPFIKNGAIFVATEKNHQLEEILILKLQLFADEYILRGKVIWINPKVAGKMPGVGLQFYDENAEVISAKIDSLLADYARATDLTETM